MKISNIVRVQNLLYGFKILNPNNHFYLIGLTFALAATLTAFEWRTTYNPKSELPGVQYDELVFVEEPPICIIKKIKEKIAVAKMKKSATASIKVTDQIVVVNNDVATTDNKLNLPDPNEIVKPYDFGDEPVLVERDVFTPVEQMPAFPGGETELLKFLKNNVNYPKMSKETGITGIVFVEFIIDVDGSMTNIKIAKGVSSDIDKEALRVVNMMPKWIPGSQRNKPVQVGMRLPIRFTLV